MGPVKRLKLCEAIKSDIASGLYLPGGFLPNEFDLADKYGYSRNTVRPALATLENEKIIELLKGRGRRVCPVNVKAPVPLTFLLPCADFLSDTREYPYALHLRQMLKGVSQIAFEHNCRVQTVPVSPTNYQHNIDLKQLDFVDSNSKLLVHNYWYADLFPLFKERGCKIAFVETQARYFKLYADYLKNWFVLTIDRENAAEAAVKFLAERGCRRIALANGFIEEKDHPIMSGYKSGLAKCGLRYAAWIDTRAITDEIIGRFIADFYKKNKFDALLLDPQLVFRLRTQHSLNYYLGLPSSVRIMADNEMSYNQQAFPSLSSLVFPYEEIGRIAARLLLEDEFRPGRQIFSAQIIERESTMQHSALVTA